MTTSSSSGTIKTQSSTSEVEAYLAVDEHGQEDTTPLLVLERVPSHVGPVSAKLADLYDIVGAESNFALNSIPGLNHRFLLDRNAQLGVFHRNSGIEGES